MIIQCEGCASKYFLPEDKVPTKPLKVKCPQCQAVFTLVPPTENVVAEVSDSMVSSAAATTEAAAPAPTPPTGSASQMPLEDEAPKAPSKRSERPSDPKQARAQRLARVLVSDILCYNQDRRDQALIDGNLMTALGDEIKKSWELYKEKVGADLANSTNYFKEALNEILADGQEIF